MKISTVLAMLALAIWLAASNAHAQITSLCDGMNACSVYRSVPVGVATRVTLSWNGEVIVGSRMSERLMSDVGQFRIGDPVSGRTVASVKTPLLQSIGPAEEKEAVPFRITETVQVPAEVSRQAVESGFTELYFVRRFNLGGTGVVMASQRIGLQQSVPGRGASARMDAEPSSTGVQLERISLLFDRATLTETIDADESLRAEARIRYQGAGLLNAVWEVAMPSSIQGSAVFVPFAQVREYLGGTREVTLESPALPARSTGIHRVRLRVLEPSFNNDPVLLTYRVAGRSLQQREEVPTINASQPRSARPVSENTSFQWQPVRDSSVYRLEFYDRWPSDAAPGVRDSDAPTRQAQFGLEPATGLMVAGDRSSVRIGPAVARRLQPGTLYYWRLIAMDGEGRIIGASALGGLGP